jgi:prolyl-tRNA synthetase
MALGPTHEEVVTDLLKEIRSHKQLPVTVYQIQTKFRDEPRPRGGIIRSKEFLMKDAYSFDTTREGLEKSYQAMEAAYRTIFARCGVNALVCEADPGMMGGIASREFMAPSENGEDLVVRCGACGYAANLEAAAVKPPSGAPAAKAAQALEVVKTPGQHTVEQVSKFLKVEPKQLIKTLIYDVQKEQVAVLVRGDHELNEAKLARLLGTPHLKLSNAQTIENITGAPVGFSGPVKLAVRMVADHAVMQMSDAVTGANQAEAHLVHVVPGRDFTPKDVADLRVVTEADPCPKCGGALAFVRAIEVGHVFQLGTKYTQALGAVFQDPAAGSSPMIMGCYGIGINRILAAAVEQHHDADGIVWPTALAPFAVVISVMEVGNPDLAKAAEAAYEALTTAGLDVLLDDREQSPGSKLKDADLVGVPVKVVVGKAWLAGQELELGRRGSRDRLRVKPDGLVAAVHKLLDTPLTPS